MLPNGKILTKEIINDINTGTFPCDSEIIIKPVIQFLLLAFHLPTEAI